MAYDAQAPAEVTARDRVIQLRDFLETLPPEKFTMRRYFTGPGGVTIVPSSFNECGTAACIAGWAILQFGDDDRKSHRSVAGGLLGLSDEQAIALFDPEGNDGTEAALNHFTRARAVAVLDHYLETGKIDWRPVNG